MKTGDKKPAKAPRMTQAERTAISDGKMYDAAIELIGEMGLARRVEATIEDVISTVHAHPTMHEALHEAALATENRAIHA